MNINFEVLIQRNFSPHILGRIETINSSIINCMIPIGSFLGGLIVQHFEAGIAILLQGLAEVLTAILNEEKAEFWIKKMTTKIEKYVLLKYQKNTIPVYGT